MNKNLDFLGAGDPGALDFLLQHLNGNTSQKDWDIWFAQFSWLYADINPLKKPKPLPEFVSSDPDAKGHIEHFCGTIGWEIGHILNEEKRHWLLDAAKTQKQSSVFTVAEAFELLCKAEAFEAITKKRLPTIKTFSMEGGEGFLVAVESVIKHAQEINIVLGGMHRGRMTQNALLFGASPEDMIGQFKANQTYLMTLEPPQMCLIIWGLLASAPMTRLFGFPPTLRICPLLHLLLWVMRVAKKNNA